MNQQRTQGGAFNNPTGNLIKKKKIHLQTREIVRVNVRITDLIQQAMLKNGTVQFYS